MLRESGGVWVTKEGEHLLVEEMDTDHIRNCINKLTKTVDFANKEVYGYVLNTMESYDRLRLELRIRELEEKVNALERIDI